MLIRAYLARRVFSPVGGIFLFAVIVVGIFYLAQVLNVAASDGWPLNLVLVTAGLRLLLYFDVLVPMALLIGAVVGLGRVQQANELTALQSAGVGRTQLVWLLAGWVVLLCFLVAFLSIWIRPWGYGQIYKIEAALAQRLDVTKIEPGRFQVGDEAWLIYADGREDEVLSDVFVHQRTPGGRGLLTARKMTQRVDSDGIIRLIFEGDVSSYLDNNQGPEEAHWLVGHFERLEVLVEPQPSSVREKIRRAQPIGVLWGSEGSIEAAELQWRLVAPLSVIVLAWLALSMISSRPRVQRSVFLVTALICGTLYFSLLGVLVNWVEKGKLDPWPGVFLAPTAVAVILAMVSMFRRSSA